MSDETREKMKASFWNNRDREEHLKWLSSISKGRKASWKAGKQSQDYIEKRMNSIKKPILQFSLDGTLIKEWKSAKDIENETGFTSDYISQNCRGIIKKFKNYIWKYKNNLGIIKENL